MRGWWLVNEQENNSSSEATDIERNIWAINALIEGLVAQRHRMYAKLHDLDMDIVLQCIEEKGLTSREVLALINDYEKPS